jgi:carboxynorspermidine decarboxylase
LNLDHIPSPCFVLEEKLLIRNLELIAGVKEASGAHIIVALKGFSMYHVFPLLKKYLSGATASSLHEARLIAEEMKCKAHTYSPAYKPEEFDEVLAHSSHITFNSLSQYERFKGKVLAHTEKVSMGLRINPEYAEVETDMYNPCVPGSRLGITRAALGSDLPEGIEGLHSHTLCENDSYVLERTLVHIEEKFGDLLHKVKWLNLGGGHLMTREGYDTAHLVAQINRIREKYNVEVILEPGSAIGWQTGFLRSKVLDIVDGQGTNVAIVDVSFAAHMPDTLEMPYTPAVRNTSETGKYNYTLGGMTCLAGDYIKGYNFENKLEIGQDIIFEDMIHYTMVKTTTFNGVGLPAIGMIKQNGEFVLLKKLGYESFKDRL